MAEKKTRKTGWQIKWKKSRSEPYQVEFFDSELAADQFKLLVEAAGNDWPTDALGRRWIKGEGFVDPEDLVEDDAINCTPFIAFSQKRTEGLMKARHVGADTFRKYQRYARLFVDALPVALALAEVMADDDDLRLRFIEDRTAAGPLAVDLQVVTERNPNFCIEDIDKSVIAAWVDYMRATGRSTKTIRNYHGFLHGVFEEAVEEELITRNPCASTKLEANVPTRKKVVLEADEFWLLHKHMKADQQDLIEFTVGTGMRFGEVSALTVADWNPDTGIVTVDKAWKKGMRGYVVGKPKTDAGVRQVYVTGRVAEILNQHAEGKKPHQLLFTAKRGGQLRQNTFWSDRWEPAVRAARAEGLTKQPVFHDLRHTHVSWLRDGGMPDAAISGLVGHTDQGMTGKYGSVTRETFAAAAAAVDMKMRRK